MLWGRITRVDDKYSGLMSKENNFKEKFKLALYLQKKLFRMII